MRYATEIIFRQQAAVYVTKCYFLLVELKIPMNFRFSMYFLPVLNVVGVLYYYESELRLLSITNTSVYLNFYPAISDLSNYSSSFFRLSTLR